MKVSFAESHVLSSQGLQQNQAFKIRTSAHAFKILSSGLYSDKIAAVLREIGCNAYDAHVLAGKADTPFEVKLPNSIDNQFWIKDWGPGLSHDEVMNLYTTYFASTKQDSNDFTGAFGLGSKSPFSYTDSFTITSCNGGFNRIYSAHIDNTGSPNIALMSESQSDESTGITISFPVRPADFSTFKQRAQTIFKYFKTLPKVLGSEQIKPLEVEEDFGSYAFIKHNYIGSQIYLQMGNVCYPVNTNELPNAETGILYLNRILIRLPIGEVQVAASREQIQYDPESQKRIIKALYEIIYAMCKNLEARWLAQTKSGLWADICKFHETNNLSSRGVSLTEKLYVKAGVQDPAGLHAACTSHGIKLPDFTPRAKYIAYEVNKYRLKYKLDMQKPGQNYIFKNDITLVSGADTYAPSRVRHALQNQTLFGRIILVTPNKKENGTKADLDQMLAVLKAKFLGVPEKKLSELDIPVFAKTPRVPKGQLRPLPADMPANGVYVNVHTRSNWGNARTQWLIAENTSLDYYQQKLLREKVEEIKNLVTLAQPIQLSTAKIKSLKLAERPEFKDYKTYIIETFSDQKNLANLKAQVKAFKFQVDMYVRQDQEGLLRNLVHLKEHSSTAFNSLKPVLTKYKILDVVEQVHRESKKPKQQRTVLTACKELINLLGIKLVLPEFEMPVIKVDETYKKASEVEYRTFTAVWEHTPDLFPKFVEQLLTKG